MMRKMYNHTDDGIGGGTTTAEPNSVQAIVAEAKQHEDKFNSEIQETPKLAIGTAEPKAEPTPEQNQDPKPNFFGKDFFTGGVEDDKGEERKEEPYQPFNNGPEPEQQQPANTQSKDGIKIETFLKVRNQLQAQLCAMIAKTENSNRYLLSDAQLDLLAEAYEPYADEITGKLPPWVMVLAVEAITTGRMLVLAFGDRKVSVANARAMKTAQAAAQKEGKQVAFNPSYAKSNDHLKGERTRYEISGKFYTYTRKFGDSKPTYIKKDSDLQREPVNTSDIEAMKHIILKNGGWKSVAKSLELPREWFIQRGLNTDNPEIDD